MSERRKWLIGPLLFVALILGSLGAAAVAQDGGDGFDVYPLAKGTEDDDLPDAQRREYYKELLQSARPVPDRDGDPTTMHGVLPDGQEVEVDVMTSKPELYRGRTIHDEARVYP